MIQDNTNVQQRIWHDSAHASLCVLGAHLHHIHFFKPLEQRVQIRQKVLKYTPVQQLEMFLVGLRAFAKAVSHTATTVRVDPALIAEIAAAWVCRAVGHRPAASCGHRAGCGRPASRTG